MPLHLFLGLVTQAIDIVEKYCKQLDHDIRMDQGVDEEELEGIYADIEDLSNEVGNNI